METRFVLTGRLKQRKLLTMLLGGHRSATSKTANDRLEAGFAKFRQGGLEMWPFTATLPLQHP